MLKLLEEPPKTTIFIMATTDPQKIPNTILSRCQRYDFQKISFEGIVNRLEYIIEQENIINQPQILLNDVEADREIFEASQIKYEQEAIEYIAKVAEGGMRNAISMLDKCISYNKNLTVENVVKALGISDYESLDKLLLYMELQEQKQCIDTVEEIYRRGKDLKQFIKQEIQFILDVCKYVIYNNYNYIQIPNTIDLSHYRDNCKYDKLLEILDKMIKLSNDIKYEQNAKVLIEAEILLICKGE